METGERKIFSRRGDFLKELISLWRVVATVFLFQFIAGLIGLSIGRFDSSFLNFWQSSAISTPFGFTTGLIWQIKTNSKTWTNHKATLLLLGFICFTLFVAALLLPTILKHSEALNR